MTTPSKDRTSGRRLLLRSLLFCAILALLLAYTSSVLKPARMGGKAGAAWTSYLSEPKNSLDVVFFGSSHVFDGVDPAIIWRTRGIPTFDHAGPAQPLEVTEYYVREALRTQKPKVVAVEVSSLSRDPELFSRKMHQVNIGYMPWGVNRLGATFNATPAGERLAVLLDLWIYRSRWSELTLKDFDITKKNRGAEYLKGYLPQFRSTEVTAPPYVMPADVKERTDRHMKHNIEHLRAIAEVCRQNDTELLIFLTPTGPPRTYSYQIRWAAEELREYDVEWLDLSEPGAVPGLSFTEDFFDGGHLNYMGADKASSVLADFLAETYDLPDRSDDPAYAKRWNESSRLRDEHISDRGGKP